MDRRRFLQYAGGMAAGLAAGCSRQAAVHKAEQRTPRSSPTVRRGEIFVAKGGSPSEMTEAVIAAAGGLSFIKPGSKVVLKPNAAWARTAEQAATTHPDVVRAMIKLCKKAGASEVTVFEHTIDRPSQMVLAVSGIAKAAADEGAKLVLASGEQDFDRLDIPRGKMNKSDTIARSVAEADVFINLPKAKCHSQTELTLGMKNLMGIIWNRQAWHSSPDLHQYIADYASAVHIDLTVIDATRILLTNGPKGPGETKDARTIIASFDPVAADAYAAGFFGMKPSDISYIAKAGELGIGEHDISKIKAVKA